MSSVADELLAVARRPKNKVCASVLAGDPDPYFLVSWTRFLYHDMQHEGFCTKDGGTADLWVGGPLIAQWRNKLVRQFLEQHTQCDWLWMIDDDMTFEPNALAGLMAAADPVERPIVAGLCFGFNSHTGEPFPTLQVWNGERFGKIREWERNSLIGGRGLITGAACMLVHRSALERIGEANSTAYPWFAEAELDGHPQGEDTVFCIRAAELDIPIFVHTGVEFGHMKPHKVTSATYTAWLSTQEKEPQP